MPLFPSKTLSRHGSDSFRHDDRFPHCVTAFIFIYFYFQVQVPPTWIQRPSKVKGIETQEAEFSCAAAGTPHPSYVWVDWEGRDALDKQK